MNAHFIRKFQFRILKIVMWKCCVPVKKQFDLALLVIILVTVKKLLVGTIDISDHFRLNSSLFLSLIPPRNITTEVDWVDMGWVDMGW